MGATKVLRVYSILYFLKEYYKPYIRSERVSLEVNISAASIGSQHNKYGNK